MTEIIPPDQEIIEPQRAADGAIVPGPATTGGQFIDMIEDGQLSADMHEQLRDLAAKMQDVYKQTGKSVKAQLQITVDMTFEEGAIFKMAAKVKAKAPELPRPKSVLWADEHNRFTRFPPNQGQFFGVRDVGAGSGGIRRV